MATGTLTLQQTANPGAGGANLARFYVNLSNQPCVVLNDGTERRVPTLTANGPLNPPDGAGLNTLGSANLGWKQLYADFNITTTVGNVTMNKAAGRVIVAAAASNVVVTNNLVTANSVVIAVAAANDTTGLVRNVVAAAGNFTINCNAPTANMPVNFWLVSTD